MFVMTLQIHLKKYTFKMMKKKRMQTPTFNHKLKKKHKKIPKVRKNKRKNKSKRKNKNKKKTELPTAWRINRNHPLDQLMTSKFEMSMMGELTFFLGIQVKKMRDGTFIFQIKYCKELLKRFEIDNTKAMATPMSTKWRDWVWNNRTLPPPPPKVSSGGLVDDAWKTKNKKRLRRFMTVDAQCIPAGI